MSHNEPTEDRLYRDPELAQFYNLENRCPPDFDYCLRLAGDARSVLDLGCGTGRLAARLDGAGLKVDKWLGDWNCAACGPASPEFIPLGRLC